MPPAVTGLETEVIERKPAPAPEPAEKNGEPPLTAPHKNGEESRPVVAGFDTEIITQKPEPEPAEKNGEPPLTLPRENGEEARQITLVPDRKIAGRKPGRPKRKKSALNRSRIPGTRSKVPPRIRLRYFGNSAPRNRSA